MQDHVIIAKEDDSTEACLLRLLRSAKVNLDENFRERHPSFKKDMVLEIVSTQIELAIEFVERRGAGA